MQYDRESVINYFATKYSYLNRMDLEIMYDCAYDILLNLRYPSHENISELPDTFLTKHRTWILRAIQEHIDKEGMTNVTSYQENGVRIDFDRAGLSRDLIQEIKPKAKIGVVSL